VNRPRVLFVAGKDCIESYSAMPLSGAIVETCPLREALDPGINCEVDIMVIDCGYDAKRGLELLKGLKASNPGIPIVFITDDSLEITAIDAFRVGAREYFKKPVNVFELKNTVENLLRLKEIPQERRSHLVTFKGGDSSEKLESVTTEKPVGLLRAIRYIEVNLSSKITLPELASESNLSKFHFCRSFSRYFGMTPMSYIASMRIERAKSLLKRDGLTVSTVAFEVGYNDLGSFIRHFKKHAGMAPSRYRATIRRDMPS
jgi:AraC-like DNA-binding protein/CheY-like chemotaxis protein